MDVFTALAEPTRRKFVEMLASSGKMSATDISNKFHSTPPAISQHLKVLKEAELVSVEKRAQMRIYQINVKKMRELESWVQKMAKLWDARFEALDKVLELEKAKSERKGVKK